MSKYFLGSLLMLLFLSQSIWAQEKHVFSGYVRDGANGEELIGATIVITDINSGVVTNPYGFFSITLPKGKYLVKVSYIGFNTINFPLDLSQDVTKNFELGSESIVTDEVVITSEKLDQNVSDIGMSKVKMDIEQVKKLPALFGEVDIIKNVQKCVA